MIIHCMICIYLIYCQCRCRSSQISTGGVYPRSTDHHIPREICHRTGGIQYLIFHWHSYLLGNIWLTWTCSEALSEMARDRSVYICWYRVCVGRKKMACCRHLMTAQDRPSWIFGPAKDHELHGAFWTHENTRCWPVLPCLWLQSGGQSSMGLWARERWRRWRFLRSPLQILVPQLGTY